MSKAKRLLRQVLEYHRADGVRCRASVKDRVVISGVRGQNGLFDLHMSVVDEPLMLRVYVRLPVVVPEERRTAVAETVARCNYGLRLGCFELDMSGGMLAFRNHFPVLDGALTQEQFRALVHSTCGVVDDYYRAFLRLLYGDDLSPAEVVAEVEMAS